jgi:hypothetical protein
MPKYKLTILFDEEEPGKNIEVEAEDAYAAEDYGFNHLGLKISLIE